MAVWPVSMGGSYPGAPERESEPKPVPVKRQRQKPVEEPVEVVAGDE
jgi:hypothetical protein